MKAPKNKKEFTINIGLDILCSLAGIPASWEGLEAVTNANDMFNGCTTLTSIPSSWVCLGESTSASKL